MHRSCRSLIASLLCLAGLTSAWAAEPIETALAKPANLDFDSLPLKEVIASLSKAHQLPIVADLQSLEAARIRSDDLAITAHVRGQPLGSALEDVLRPHKLTWIVRHEALFLTTLRAAQEKYHDTRVYKVTRPVPLARRIVTITQTVAPETWANVGGPGDAAPLPPALLLIHQSPLVHRQIAAKFANSLVPVRARPVAEPAEQEIEKKLAAPALIDFNNVRLADALQQFRDAHGVKISLDEPSLKQAGLRSDGLVTLQIGKRLTLASGLSLMLERIAKDLAWTVDDTGVTVTTVAAAKAKLIRRTYKVSDILPADGLDPLIGAIESTLAAADWENVGGLGAIKPGAERGTLEVSQSYPVHRQLRQLFAELRAARDKE